MLDDLRDPRVIERKREAVQAVHQVVHLIWLMAQTQLAEVEQTAADTSHYLDWVDDTVARLAGRVRSPTLGADRAHVVFGPERGYCGSLARDVIDQIPDEGPVGMVGTNLAEHASRHPELMARVVFQLPGASNVAEHEGVAYAVAAEALRLGADGRAVQILYPPGAGSALKSAIILGGEREVVHLPPETFSPAPVVLDAAVHELVTGRLAVAAIEALRSEVRARLVAADRARQGCERRAEQLLASWRVARQAQITGELLEVVAGHLASQPTEAGVTG
jgi:hypothetical protein